MVGNSETFQICVIMCTNCISFLSEFLVYIRVFFISNVNILFIFFK